MSQKQNFKKEKEKKKRADQRQGRGLFIKVCVYLSSFVSKIITGNIMKLVRQVDSKNRIIYPMAIITIQYSPPLNFIMWIKKQKNLQLSVLLK